MKGHLSTSRLGATLLAAVAMTNIADVAAAKPYPTAISLFQTGSVPPGCVMTAQLWFNGQPLQLNAHTVKFYKMPLATYLGAAITNNNGRAVRIVPRGTAVQARTQSTTTVVLSSNSWYCF